MKGKDIKQAKIHTVTLDKERPLTFDFNTLCELQENGYYDPIRAVREMELMNLTAIRALFYSALISGHFAKGLEEQFDLSMAEIGQYLGYYMQNDKEEFQKNMKALQESIRDFFPEIKEAYEKAQKEEEKEEKSETEEKKLINQSPPIEWDWYYYVATVELGFREEEFWRTTMKKLDILWKTRMKFTRPQEVAERSVVKNSKTKKEFGKNERAYIDEILP